eukprot:COSAG01_NODE_57163_length_314_cov_0.683721_1_plen_20_part_01
MEPEPEPEPSIQPGSTHTVL